jgi:hypothetical protein
MGDEIFMDIEEGLKLTVKFIKLVKLQTYKSYRFVCLNPLRFHNITGLF